MELLTIVAIILLGVIFYFLYRLRAMVKALPGANSKMTTKELIKNWQEQKFKENEYQNELRQRAREQAKPIIEETLIKRYTDEEIRRVTTDKGSQLKDKLREGMGIDLDKATSQTSMDKMIGRNNNSNNAVVDSTNIFNQDKIKRMTGNGINEDSLMKNTKPLNFKTGAKEMTKTNLSFTGIREAVERDKQTTNRISATKKY